MADRFLVIQKTALLLTLIVGLCCISQAQASARQTIRFYKVDRQVQADRIKFTKKKASKAGCHSFRKKARVYKTVQIGYSWCSVYAKKDCASGSIISVSKQDPAKEDKPTPRPEDSEDIVGPDNAQSELRIDENLTEEMTEGIAWYPASEHKRGAKIGSWNCSLTAKDLSD